PFPRVPSANRACPGPIPAETADLGSWGRQPDGGKQPRPCGVALPRCRVPTGPAAPRVSDRQFSIPLAPTLPPEERPGDGRRAFFFLEHCVSGLGPGPLHPDGKLRGGGGRRLEHDLALDEAVRL